MAKEKDWDEDSSCFNCGDTFYESSKTTGICSGCYLDPEMEYWAGTSPATSELQSDASILGLQHLYPTGDLNS